MTLTPPLQHPRKTPMPVKREIRRRIDAFWGKANKAALVELIRALQAVSEKME